MRDSSSASWSAYSRATTPATCDSSPQRRRSDAVPRMSPRLAVAARSSKYSQRATMLRTALVSASKVMALMVGSPVCVCWLAGGVQRAEGGALGIVLVGVPQCIGLGGGGLLPIRIKRAGALGGHGGRHGIVAPRPERFGAAVIGHAHPEGLAVRGGDGLGGALGDGAPNDAIVVANAAGGISDAGFKLHHGAFPCVRWCV